MNVVKTNNISKRPFVNDSRAFARIPFSFAAVALLVSSTILAGSILELSRLKHEKILEQRMKLVERISAEESEWVEITAYRSLQDSLANISSSDDLKKTNLNDLVRTMCSIRFNENYPKKTETHEIDIMRYEIIVMEDHSPVSPDGSSNNIQYEIAVPVYLKLAGVVHFNVRLNEPGGINAYFTAKFDKLLNIPLPMLLNSLEIFKAQSSGSRSELARLTKYILTTTAQMRVLSGRGLQEDSIPDIISEADVRKALNLAVILEHARIFRAYDKELARSAGLDSTLNKYIDSGKLDGAELFSVLNGFENEHLDLGGILAESIITFTDEFVYRILTTIWPDETPDSVLQEPDIDWDRLKAKGEGFAKKKLVEWLQKFKSWLLLPPYLLSHFGSGSIPKIEKHATGIDEVSTYPIPLVVRGNYEIFSMPYPALWFIYTGGVHIDKNRWPPVEITIDPVDLILGQGGSEDYLPEPYEISFLSSFGLPETIKYYMVHRSFLAIYGNPGSSTPYFDCLKNVLEILLESVSTEKTDSQDTKTAGGTGLVDLMAEDTGALAGSRFHDIHWSDIDGAEIDPEDEHHFISSGTGAMLRSLGAPALELFRSLARGHEISSLIPGGSSWYEDGLLSKNSGNGLYELCVNTVDLFYELFWTLKKSSEASAGDYNEKWASNFPLVHFADLQTDQQKKSSSEHFNFNRDAVKHSYNSVWSIVLLHLVPIRSYFHPDAFSLGRFEFSVPPISAAAWYWFGYEHYSFGSHASNRALWDYVKKSLKNCLNSALGPKTGIRLEVDAAIKLLDITTDDRTYKTFFHEFVWLNLGSELIAPSKLSKGSATEQLISKDPGWLETSFLKTLPDSLNRYLDHQNIILTTESKSQLPYKFRKSYNGQKSDQVYDFREAFDIKFKAGSRNSPTNPDIIISEPVLEPRFVSVQERESDLCDAPFVTSWAVSVSGNFNFEIATKNKCKFGATEYESFSLNENIPYHFEFSISVFSGWPLLKKQYPMTKTVFSKDGIESGSNLLLSSKMLELESARTGFESCIYDRLDTAVQFISEHPLAGFEKRPGGTEQKKSSLEDLEKIQNFVQDSFFTVYNSKIEQLYIALGKTGSTELNSIGYGLNIEYTLGTEPSVISKPDTQAGNEELNLIYENSAVRTGAKLVYKSGYLKLDLEFNSPDRSSGNAIILLAHTPNFDIESVSDPPGHTDAGNKYFLHLRTGNKTLKFGISLQPLELEKNFHDRLEKTRRQKYFDEYEPTAAAGSDILYELNEFLESIPEPVQAKARVTLFYEISNNFGISKVLSVYIKEQKSIDKIRSYVDTTALVQYDFIDYLMGKNGGAIRNIPPVYYAMLLDHGLSLADVMITFTTISANKSITEIQSTTLDLLCGPGGVINVKSKRGIGRIQTSTGPNEKYLIGLSYDRI